jgi:hypothetical protein
MSRRIGSMAEFCTCGSLKIKGSCTKKGCEGNVSKVAYASFAQVAFIRTLQQQTGDDRFVDFMNITSLEASHLIDELLERKEMGV